MKPAAPPRPEFRGDRETRREPRRAPTPIDLRLLAPAAVFWLVCALLLGVNARVSLGVALGAGIASAGVIAWARRQREYGRRQAHALHTFGSLPAALVLVMLALTCAALASSYHAWRFESRAVAGPVEVVGKVLTSPKALTRRFGEPAYRVTIQALKIAQDGHELGKSGVRMEAIGPGWGPRKRGETVFISGKIKEIQEPLTIKNRGDPRLIAPAQGAARAVNWVQERARACTRALPSASRELLLAIALGQRGNLPAGLKDQLATASLTHLVAVSGTHTGVILGAVLAAVRRLPPRQRFLIGVSALIGFVTLVGQAESVIRASFMGAVAMAGLTFGRASRPIAALCLTVIGMLTFNPLQARSYSFALSVSATAGIVILGPGTIRILSRFLPRWLAAILGISAVAQLACLPFLLPIAPYLPTYGILANLLAAPVVTVVVLGGMLMALVGAVSIPAGSGIAAFLQPPVEWISGVAGTVAGWPGARIPWGSSGGVIAITVAFGAVIVLGVASLGYRKT